MIVSLLVAAIAFGEAPVSQDSSFNGLWIADLTRSTLHANSPLREATLHFTVTAETVSVSHFGRDYSGRTTGDGRSVFRTDGKPHPHEELRPGLMAVATWRSPRHLETVLTSRSGEVNHVSYDLSDDEKTVTVKTAGPLGSQVIVFIRP